MPDGRIATFGLGCLTFSAIFVLVGAYLAYLAWLIVIDVWLFKLRSRFREQGRGQDYSYATAMIAFMTILIITGVIKLCWGVSVPARQSYRAAKGRCILVFAFLIGLLDIVFLVRLCAWLPQFRSDGSQGDVTRCILYIAAIAIGHGLRLSELLLCLVLASCVDAAEQALT